MASLTIDDLVRAQQWELEKTIACGGGEGSFVIAEAQSLLRFVAFPRELYWDRSSPYKTG